MKKLFLIMILLFIIFLTVDSVKYIDNYNNSVKTVKELQQQGYQGNLPSHMNVFDKVNDYYRNGATVTIQFIYPLLVIVVGCYIFHQKLHSGFLKNVISRKRYEKYMKNEIFSCWKAILLIPIFFITTFIFSCVVTNFNFNVLPGSFDIINNTSILSNKELIVSRSIDLIILCTNLSIVSIACINIGLFFTKRNKNFIIMSIFSYLFLLVYQIAMEIIVGPILSNVFNDNFYANGVTLFSFWFYDTGVTYLKMAVYGLLLVILTIMMLKKTYKNKEDVIICAEK